MLRVVTNCKECRGELRLKKTASNRYELSKKVGVKVSMICESCKTKKMYDLNDFDAEEPTWLKLAYPVSIILSIIIVIILWDKGTRMNSYALIPTALIIVNMITAAVVFTQKYNVRYFNKFRVG